MVLIDLSVTIVVGVIYWSIVDIVVWTTRIAESWENRPGCAKRSSPFELIVPIQVYTIATRIYFFVNIRNRSNSRMGIVPEILPPTWRVAVPSVFATEHLSVISVAVNIQHRYEIYFSGVDQISDILLGEVLVYTQITRATWLSIAIGVLEVRGQRETITIIVELPISIGVAPCVLINLSVTVVVDTSCPVVVSKRL